MQADELRMRLNMWTSRSSAERRSMTRKYWREALRAGIDGAGSFGRTGPGARGAGAFAMDGEQEVAADLFTPAVVPAHPAALALALLMERCSTPRRCGRPRQR